MMLNRTGRCHADGFILWKQDLNTHKVSSFFHDILCLAAFLAKGVFVKQVFSHAVFRSSHAPQVGHPVCQFFDGLHLLVQEMCLDEITQLKQYINSLERKKWISLALNKAVFFPISTSTLFDTRMYEINCLYC